MKVATGLGQDSHCFEASPSGKPLRIGGVAFDGAPALEGNSDADVLLHALVNAISGIHGVVVLGPVTDALCKAGVTDSAEYVKEALKHLGPARLSHVSCSLECSRPKIGPRIEAIRASLSGLLGLAERHVAVTAHSGEGLSAYGRGEGILATVIVTAEIP
ncbi:MAG TPA: 2-C-methyl-D-erythritol 2,4-cyclodiphosphate synthase [bacterium]|nr:2-C-methyl-D-erythritol 2,4-cyclodiphosphate synthase [bacterium]